MGQRAALAIRNSKCIGSESSGVMDHNSDCHRPKSRMLWVEIADMVGRNSYVMGIAAHRISDSSDFA